MPTRQGSVHLFCFAGVDVYLHWAWFLMAAIEISTRTRDYSSFVWNVLEYLALFVIVLMHEYGHALSCRQVGGNANRIVLWPLGGVAYVDPPPRPGATLWSIAAGPLVNVALLVILIPIGFAGGALPWIQTVPGDVTLALPPDVRVLVKALVGINVVLLAFNLLPIYPLDGGQILRSLLWFVMGRARSLMVATLIGMLGVVGLVALAIYLESRWMAIMAVFILWNCWAGMKEARAMIRLGKMPQHSEYTCPACQTSPPAVPLWICFRCSQLSQLTVPRIDLFRTQGRCPDCGQPAATIRCPFCGTESPLPAWSAPVPIAAASER